LTIPEQAMVGERLYKKEYFFQVAGPPFVEPTRGAIT
jgi:hypothetical protein